MKSCTIAITSTFTVDPIEEVMNFWMEELGSSFKIEFAPYNQVFQQLHDSSSLLSQNLNGFNIVLIRFEDWVRFDDHETAEIVSPVFYEEIERNIQELVSVLIAAAEESLVPFLVSICHPSPSILENTRLRKFLSQKEEHLEVVLNDINGIYFLPSSETSAIYPITEYYNSYSDRLFHIPYTFAFYVSLGTMLARKIYSLQTMLYKVIVLDCDQTLWKGICGEDGPFGIEIDEPRKIMQEFMVDKHNKGWLICLCSKNNEEEIAEVFARRHNMLLKRENITLWRVNWKPKSENIKSLANELQLSLDTFIFIDDDPVECAEVKANCPEVLTLQLPPNSNDIPEFLKHVWAFDKNTVTREDLIRSDFYRQNIARESFRNRTLSFEHFLASLDLEVEILDMSAQQLVRVEQLIQRTNQFNLTTIHRTTRELQKVCRSKNFKCLTVNVSDRFGGYGLVGVIIVKVDTHTFQVDTFLLSCRAMGRGVEHQMLARLGRMAMETSIGYIEIPYVSTSRNKPVLDFLENVGSKYKVQISNNVYYKLPTNYVAELTYELADLKTKQIQDTWATQQPSTATSTAKTSERNALLYKIAIELQNVEQIQNVIRSRKRERPDLEVAFVAPRTPTEKTLTEVWSDLIGVDQIGIHDDFFSLGGHSLTATQLLSQVFELFGVELSLRVVFTADEFTIAELAKVVELNQISMADDEVTAAILEELNNLSDEEIRVLLENEH